MAKHQKTLILTVDMQGGADWQVKALQQQMADWLETNKTIMPTENLIILPASGPTRLFWLEGEPTDIKTLEEIKDRIKPILEVALDIKIDKNGLFERPSNKKFDEALKHATKRTINVGPKFPKFPSP